MARRKKEPRTLAYYNDKLVDMATYVHNPKQRYQLAAQRISDNMADGYVIELHDEMENSLVWKMNSRINRPRPVTGEERDQVLEEVSALEGR